MIKWFFRRRHNRRAHLLGKWLPSTPQPKANECHRLESYRLGELAAGATCEILAMALGRDLADAKKFFHKFINQPAISNGMARTPWRDDELTFEKLEVKCTA